MSARQEKALAEVLAKLGEYTSKLDDHIGWSEGYVKDTGDRLAALETERRRGLLRRH